MMEALPTFTTQVDPQPGAVLLTLSWVPGEPLGMLDVSTVDPEIVLEATTRLLEWLRPFTEAEVIRSFAQA